MKKIASIITMLLFVNLTFAQYQQQHSFIQTDEPKEDFAIVLHSNPFHFLYQKTTRANSRWYDYYTSFDTVNQFTNGVPSIFLPNHLNSNTIWQDTTLKLGYTTNGTTTYGGTRNKGFAVTFDPTSEYYNHPIINATQMKIKRTDSFVVDSIGLLCKYYRVANKPNIVDTLIVSTCYGTGANTGDLRNFYYALPSTTPANYSTDTLRYITPVYDFNTKACKGITTVTRRILLNAQSGYDSLPNGFNFFQIPIGMTVPNANVVGTFIMFRSGDTWPANQDSVYKYNRMRLYSWEEKVGGFQTYNKGDFSASHLFRNDTTGWGANPLPSFAFTAPYSLEHHWLSYKVTSNASSIGIGFEDVKPLQASIYPNPSNNLLMIKLAKRKPTTITLKNMLGKTCITTNTNDQSTTLNISNLQTGIYNCIITNQDGIKTEQIIITH